MAFADWAVVAAYFLVIFGVAIWAGLSDRRDTSQQFFLAGRNTGWFVIGASVFASNIGSEHLIGLAGTGASSGLAVAQFEILAGFILLLLGWFFVPFYLASGVFTMPEFLERRYSAGARRYLAIVSVIGYVLTKISVTIAAGALVFETLMGIDFWTGAAIVVIVTGAYTVWGGLRAVLYTDMIQMFVLLGGAIAVTLVGLHTLGGWSAVIAEAGPEKLSLWRTMEDPDFPWTGILFGAPILGIWYWCTDQYIVQRVLAANGIEQARRATIFAAYLKQLPMFLFVLPGLIAFLLAERGMFALERPDAALPTLIGELLPIGLKGLVVAGLLAALMSSLSSVFNSCSTIVTMDIYKPMRPQATERRLVRVGQIATLVLVGLGLAWIPMMDLISGRLYTYIQSVQAYIAPPIAAVFLVGILWSRANARGAAWSLGVGAVLGLTRFLLEMNKEGLDGFLLWVATENFLHVAFLLFVISVLVLILVSLSSPPPSTAQTCNLTMAGRKDMEWGQGIARDAVLSVGVVVLICAIWLYFS